MLRGEFTGKNKIIVSVKEAATDDDLPMLLLDGATEETNEPEPVSAAHSDSA